MKFDKGQHSYVQDVNRSMDNRIAAALEVFEVIVNLELESCKSLTRQCRLQDLAILIGDAREEAAKHVLAKAKATGSDS